MNTYQYTSKEESLSVYHPFIQLINLSLQTKKNKEKVIYLSFCINHNRKKKLIFTFSTGKIKQFRLYLTFIYFSKMNL